MIDDSKYLQKLIDEDKPIPQGEYHISETIHIRNDKPIVMKNCTIHYTGNDSAFMVVSDGNEFTNITLV